MYKNKLHILSISILVILAVVTYLNSLPNQFVYDDVSTIVENSLIKEWGISQPCFLMIISSVRESLHTGLLLQFPTLLIIHYGV